MEKIKAWQMARTRMTSWPKFCVHPSFRLIMLNTIKYNFGFNSFYSVFTGHFFNTVTLPL